jgi:hypothetical protein
MPFIDKKRPQVTPQALEAYKARLVQVDFIKKQQWVVTNYAVAIYVAIVWVAHNLRPTSFMFNLILLEITIAVATTVTLLLWQFQFDLLEARIRLDEANDYCFTRKQRKVLKEREFEVEHPEGPFKRGLNVLVPLMSVCIFGAVITVGFLISPDEDRMLCKIGYVLLLAMLMAGAVWFGFCGKRLEQAIVEAHKRLSRFLPGD